MSLLCETHGGKGPVLPVFAPTPCFHAVVDETNGATPIPSSVEKKPPRLPDIQVAFRILEISDGKSERKIRLGD